jgi:hypothetical protein
MKNVIFDFFKWTQLFIWMKTFLQIYIKFFE